MLGETALEGVIKYNFSLLSDFFYVECKYVLNYCIVINNYSIS